MEYVSSKLGVWRPDRLHICDEVSFWNIKCEFASKIPISRSPCDWIFGGQLFCWDLLPAVFTQ
jgi:hypothetical protein